MAVIGGGAMGIGIAHAFAGSGAAVSIVELNASRGAQALARIERLFQRSVELKKQSPEAASAAARRVRTVDGIAALPPALDLVIEAVPEDVALKRSVLGAVARRTPLLLASNTSGISIDELAEGLPQPERFLGLHFFNPVWTMELVEVVVGSKTGPATLAAALAACEQIGKATVVVHNSPGFASSRLGVLLGLEAMRMVEEGVAQAADIDRAMELGYRHPIGPLRLTDLVGLDVRLAIARNLCAAYGERFAPPAILVELVAAGHLGKKTGRGFYRWPPDGDGR